MTLTSTRRRDRAVSLPHPPQRARARRGARGAHPRARLLLQQQVLLPALQRRAARQGAFQVCLLNLAACVSTDPPHAGDGQVQPFHSGQAEAGGRRTERARSASSSSGRAPLARPKSVSLTWPRWSIRKFSGFKSLQLRPSQEDEAAARSAKARCCPLARLSDVPVDEAQVVQARHGRRCLSKVEQRDLLGQQSCARAAREGSGRERQDARNFALGQCSEPGRPYRNDRGASAGHRRARTPAGKDAMRIRQRRKRSDREPCACDRRRPSARRVPWRGTRRPGPGRRTSAARASRSAPP